MSLSIDQVKSRERTLLAALLLSMWAPLTTGIAVLLSHSTTQVADFIRRSVELFALFVSWQVFRYVNRRKDLTVASKAKMEKYAGLSVVAALGSSSLVMLALSFSRINSFEPGGNVYPGLTIAILGLITNAWFWRRYTNLTKEQYSSIIHAQCHLYRAKSVVDLCVIAALSSVAINPGHVAARYIDLLGSVAVAIYLLWSAVRTARGTFGDDPQMFSSKQIEGEG